MGEESKIEELREEIRKYVPVVMFDPFLSVMFTTNKVSLNKMAAYVVSLRSAQRCYGSLLALKKPFLQALWDSFGRGF